MYRIFIISILIFIVQAVPFNGTDDVLELIRQAGYRGRAYQVETEDNGWILKIHRIFPRRKSSSTIPVFLMHGLFVGSFDYIITGRQKALGYLLADNNYDIFMGNSRGNRHSAVNNERANHSTLWNFSFNEIGCYDLAAMIDYVLQLTGASKLFYVGHSQGTTSLVALLSSRPEYNSKIIQAHLFAPVVFMKYFPNDWIKETLIPIVEFAKMQNAILLNFTEIFTVLNPLSKIFCDYRLSPQTTEVCKAFIFSIVGPNIDREEVDQEVIPKLIDHISWTLSLQQFQHYFQSYYSGKFRKFDYKLNNIRIYGTYEPPEYNLSQITAPLYLYRAPGDLLTSRRDVEHLIELLPNVKHNRVIPNYNHLDFNYGKRSRKVIYNDIVKFFQSEDQHNKV